MMRVVSHSDSAIMAASELFSTRAETAEIGSADSSIVMASGVETLELRLLEAHAQIVRVHYRNNFDFRVEMVKERLGRHDDL
jgi:hypothetical protein